MFPELPVSYIFLTLGIFFSIIPVTIYKYSSNRRNNVYHFIATERLTILACISLIICFISDQSFQADIVYVGILGGISAYFSRFCLLKALEYGNLNLTTIVVGMSISIPVVASIFFWKEKPEFHQLAALFLAPLVLFLLQYQKKALKALIKPENKENHRKWLLYVLLTFFFEGGIGTSFKAVGELGLANSQDYFILFFSLTAFLLALSFGFRQDFKPSVLKLSIPSGISVTFAAFFVIRAVNELDGIIAFPTLYISIIIGALILSRFLFRESMNLHQWTGFFLSLLIIYLLSR